MKSNIKNFIFVSMILAIPNAFSAESAEYYVRVDGGTLEQCTGTTNAKWVEGSGSDDCAVKHIFELLDPRSSEVHIAGGSIINILNNIDGTAAEYPMGRHLGYTSGNCHSSWAYDCTMPSIPAGTEGKPTIIRGGLNNTCDVKPILWGTSRAKQILSLDNTSHVELSCLTITDKSSCIGASQYPDNGLICKRGAPYDKPFADTGVFIRDSNDINLTDVNIQGLSKGILAGRISDVKLERVNLFANFHAGWDGDIGYLGGNGSSNSGTIEFKDSSISFNGCGLIYNPDSPDHLSPHACAKQSQGGYGDGIGTEETAGNWIFNNVKVLHNNSDGIDLLYHTQGGLVTVTNSQIEGNAGNQLKVSGDSNIVNNIIIGTCAWNSRQDDKLGGNGENCRALGTALSLSYTHADTKVNLINNTIFSEGDCLLSGGNRTGTPNGTQKLTVVNNIFYGMTDYLQNFENSCMYYTEEPFPLNQFHNNYIHKVKGYGAPCNTTYTNDSDETLTSVCTTTGGPYYDNSDHGVISNPQLEEIKLGHKYTAYDLVSLSEQINSPRPIKDSRVINAGYDGTDIELLTPQNDFFGDPRIGKPDIGAIEFKVKPKAPVILEIIQIN